MKTPEQLKGAIRNIAKDKNLHAQEVLQIYMFERILDRLSRSEYKKNFVLKGGLLISSMIGMAERTTKDMDTTVRGIDMTEENVERVVRDILAIDTGDGIEFVLEDISPIREDDDYNNFRIKIEADYGTIRNKMKIDITTGDEITPAAIQYSYHTMFDEDDIEVMAYSLETILAEKYETILRRGIWNTRSRDFYDLYVLFHMNGDTINPEYFRLAVEHTAQKRGSSDIVPKYNAICDTLKDEDALIREWKNYVNEEEYAAHLSFEEVVQNVKEVGDYLENKQEV